MEKIIKLYKAVIKGIDEQGNVRALIGPATIDRDQEVIEPAAWEAAMPEFMAHPILLSSHSWEKLTSQIGEVVGYKVTPEGNEVTLKYYHGKGNQEADWAYFLAQQGVAAFSHGFYGLKWTDNPNAGKSAGMEPRRVYHRIELLEVSQVLVPANREALQRSLEKALHPDAAAAAAADTDTREVKSVTITIDAKNAEAFAKFLKNETAPQAGDDPKPGQTGPTTFDAILDGKAAGETHAATDDGAALKTLADAVAGLNKSLTKEI